MQKEIYNSDDQALLNLYKKTGNKQYLGILLQRYSLLLMGFCMKYLREEEKAKDATQQIFLKVIAEVHKYEISYFKSWLYTVARNHCLMELRKAGILVSDENLDYEHTAPHYHHTQLHNEQQAEKEELLNAVEYALEQLQSPQKECVKLFYFDKLSYQQIAETTGHNLKTVKSAIQNGKRNIRIWIEKYHLNE